MRKLVNVIVFALLLMALATIPSTAQQSTTDKTTLDNLQAALNGEGNAHVRYLAFAVKADQEGYGEVASLFRAAARAERVHANNHALEIKKLGGTPNAKNEAPVVKSTKENLEAAIKGETYERDVMYPEFYKQARATGHTDAVKTFNLARNAEAEHAMLFTDAYDNLAKMRGQSRTYYVCSVCGYTTKDLDFAKCHSCFSPKEKFEQVS